METFWQALVRYLDEHIDGFATRIRGASHERIEALQKLHPRPMPSAYVSFLQVLGENHDCFEFGGDRYTSIGELLAGGTPPPGVILPYPYPDPNDRFLWIAGQRDENDFNHWGDYYLDLATGNRADPPVIENDFDEYPEPDLNHSLLASQFTEFLQIRAFEDHGRVHHDNQLSLMLFCDTRDRGHKWQAVLAVLQRMGLEPVLPGGPSLWIGRKFGGMEIQVKTREYIEAEKCSIHMCIVGDRRQNVMQCAEVIRDTVTGRYISEWLEDDPPWTT